ncbi:MAG: ribosome small subunit-dependent GTPase A [Microbacteriaceae bacterium]|nr:ribosome small subunit-dependent GTPase A [Microbacteriaceae bacterium]MDR9444143.1 ribosome small subunit-dependent GTPase A [Microbacteriaceae bacterium]
MSWLYEPEDQKHDLDESDVRIRPNPKGSRPRTKRRPNYDDLPQGMVLTVNLARYQVLTDNGEITATLAKELRKQGAVVGDQVYLDGDLTGTKGTLARIVKIAPRKTLLRRSAEDEKFNEQPIVANADQLAIVMSSANPDPNIGLLDRYLASAFASGLDAILIMTKTDVHQPDDFLENLQGLPIKIFKSRIDDFKLEELKKTLANKMTVFVGYSGVGKSTLINALTGTTLDTGNVNAVTGKGKHTSSAAKAIAIEDGWLIDTPGVRTFGLGLIEKDDLLGAFEDIAEITNDCPRGCEHQLETAKCALNEENDIPLVRLNSFRRLLKVLEAEQWERK